MSSNKPFFKKIDLSHEFSLVEKNAMSQYEDLNNNDFKSAIKYAFYMGLKDARMWIDPYLHCSIPRHFRDENPNQPMVQRRIDIAQASGDYEIYNDTINHDSLLFFNQSFGLGSHLLMDCLCHTKNWSLAKRAQYVFCRILEVSPSISGSLGDLYVKNIISNIYHSGLLCAKTKNSEDVFEKIIPIYEGYNGPITSDNKDKISEIVKNDLFLSLINDICPLVDNENNPFSITKGTVGEIEKFERIDNILKSKAHFFLPLEMNF